MQTETKKSDFKSNSFAYKVNDNEASISESVEDEDDIPMNHGPTGLTDGARPADHHFDLTSKPLEIDLDEEDLDEANY